MKIRVCFIAMGLVALTPGRAPAAQPAAPRTIAFTGLLTDPGGARVTGSRAVSLSLYPAPTGQSAAWTETKTVTASNGAFSTALGDTVPFPADMDFSRAWFVAVRLGSDAEMTPRIALQSVPYALFAQNLAVGPDALSPVGAPGPLKAVAGRVEGGTGNPSGLGFTSRRVAKGIYDVTVMGVPEDSAFIATVAGSGSWTASLASANAAEDGSRAFRVETRLGTFLNDPPSFSFLIVAPR